MKALMLLALMAAFAAIQMGCEASAEVDDDDAEIKIDD
jgi:hypothetical protein